MKKSSLRKYKPYAAKLDHKAAYGLYLIQLCREADMVGERVGKFVEVKIPTLEEFIEMRQAVAKAKSGLKSDKWRK